MKTDKIIKIIRIIIAIILITVVSVVLKLSNINNIADIKNIIQLHNIRGAIIYILLFSILPTFFVTVTILAISAGAVFGLVNASIYTFLGAFINSTVTYYVSKYLAYDIINDYVKNKYSNLYLKLKKNTKGKDGFIMMVILRLLPLIPYTFLNYMSGVVGYDYKIFITSTLVGIIPGMLCYVNIGANSLNGFTPRLMISISILIAFALTTSIIAKVFYKKNI